MYKSVCLQYRNSRLYFQTGILVCLLFLASNVLANPIPFDHNRQGASLSAPYAVELHDFDNDGKLDIIARDSGFVHAEGSRMYWFTSASSLTATGGLVWASQGSLNITSVAPGNTQMGHAIADFNNDGSLDFIYTDPDGNGTINYRWYNNGVHSGFLLDADPGSSLFLGTGGTGFSGPPIAHGDMNGDEIPDVLGFVEEPAFTGLVWWLPKQSQNWVRVNIAARTSSLDTPVTLKTGDIDGDGDIDVAVYWKGSPSAKINWYENTVGDGSTWVTHTIDSGLALTSVSGHGSFDLVDIDNDGDLDLICPIEHNGEPKLNRWINPLTATTPPGNNWASQLLTPFEPAERFTVADFDLDGDMDVITVRPPVDVGTGGDKDTHSDILWNNLNTSGEFSKDALSSFARNSQVYLAAGDIDNDGDPDFIHGNWLSSRVAWNENKRSHRSNFYPQLDALSSSGDGDTLHIFDLEGDGRDEVIYSSPLAGEISIMGIAPSTSNWQTDVVVSGLTNVVESTSGDFNNDGKIDVISSVNDDSVTWFNGAASWSQTKISLAGEPGVLDAADFNGNGHDDVVVAIPSSNTILVILNLDGSPTTVTVSSTNAIDSVTTSDYDNDGDMDIIVASAKNNQVSWYLNNGDGTSWAHQILSTLTGACGVRVLRKSADGTPSVLAIGKLKLARISGLLGGTAHEITTDVQGCAMEVQDMDSDGSLDVRFNSALGGTTWFSEPQFVFQPWVLRGTTDSGEIIRSTAAGDFDGDGDLDLMVSSQSAGELQYFANLTGQYRLKTSDTAQQYMSNGQIEDVLKVTLAKVADPVITNVDGEVKLDRLAFEFRDGGGTLLSQPAVNNLIANHFIYRDSNNSGVFDLGDLPQPTTVTFFGNNVFVWFTTEVQTAPTTTIERVLFYVVELTGDAAQQSPSSFKVTHKLLSAIAEHSDDPGYATPLLQEFTSDKSSALISTKLAAASCKAPFDLNLKNLTIDYTLVCEGGESISIDSTDISTTLGHLTLRAGSSITLGNGFTVQIGGILNVEIDPGL